MESAAALYTVLISGHSESGVELYAAGELYMYGPNAISNNGNPDDPRSAGVVVDGNSEAYLRGGTLSANTGPGILALVNSSVDSVGATFLGNSGGMVTCDSSAYMVSDLIPDTGHSLAGIACRTPHHLGNRHDLGSPPVAPDFTQQNNRAAKYKAFATLH
jgi:hypothetical protein